MAGRMGSDRVTTQALKVQSPLTRAQPDPDQGRRARTKGCAGAYPRHREGRMTMTSIDIKTPGGDAAGSVELPAEVFNVQTNVPLIHQVVVAQLAAARQGTRKTKTRAEVAGGGRKPYRQKGTGRARQGSVRAPQFAGGGVVHGPTPRSYAQKTPRR